MKIKTKVLWLEILIIILPLIAGITYTYFDINHNIRQIETDKAREELAGVTAYIDSLIQAHSSSYLSVTSWDEYYQAMIKKDIPWINNNVLTNLAENTNTEIMLVFDTQKNILTEAKMPKDWQDFDFKNLALFQNVKNKPYVTGIVKIKSSLYLITIVPLARSSDLTLNNTNGFTLYARKFNNTMLNEGKKIMKVEIALVFDDGGSISTSKTLQFINKRSPDIHHEIITHSQIINNHLKITAQQVFKDYNQKPIGVLCIETSSTSGVNALNKLAVNSFILLIVLVISIVAISVLINKIIILPLNKILANLDQGTVKITNASGQLTKTSQELYTGSIKQAESIEETSATLNESSSISEQNTNNTIQASVLAEETKQAVNKSNQEMDSMLEIIQESKKASSKIATIVKMIDDIAFQTNILALNAAVEAARAGDSGLGFAVVAEEVRNLALKSAQAVNDISTMIENNFQHSEEGVLEAQKVKESLTQIAGQAKKVSDLMKEIAAAGTEQSRGVSQVNSAISQMDSITQQNVTSAQEIANTALILNDEVHNIKDIILQLTVLIEGRSSDDYYKKDLRPFPTSPF